MKTKIRNIFILLVLIFISIYYNSSLKEKLLPLNDSIVEGFLDLNDYLRHKISAHFKQARQIEYLKAENKRLRYKAELTSTFANELNAILEDKNSSAYFPKLSLVKALSYEQLNDYNKIWLDAPLYDGKIKGLISNGYTAGIVIPKDGRALALLQGDKKCAFSIYIGKDKIPGLIFGNKEDMIIRFIPRWMHIKLGDEVYTSGLDGIFFAGVLVGTITSIKDMDAYQDATVKPYILTKVPSFLYMIQNL